MAEWTRVSTAAELVEAGQGRAPAVEVAGVVRGMPMITLAPADATLGIGAAYGAYQSHRRW